eukprot:13836452-Ditylum_brightwellii.AAC.1
MNKYGHRVKSYHGDNSRFNSTEFKTSCNQANQSYSYCGVGAHHQNGIVKAKTKKLSHNGRTSILHAKRKWPDVISSALWPFSYKNVEEKHNMLDLDANSWSPLEKMLGEQEEIVADGFHIWGCPVFVLDPALQTGTGIGPPKWEPRSRAGVYLGHSPVHAGNVALVLNLHTKH